MQLNDYQKYIDTIQDLANVEADLRDAVANGNQRASAFAQRVLFERFGVEVCPNE